MASQRSKILIFVLCLCCVTVGQSHPDPNAFIAHALESSMAGHPDPKSFSAHAFGSFMASGSFDVSETVESTIGIIQQVTSTVSQFHGKFGECRLSRAISDCIDLMDASVDQLLWTLSACHNSNGKDNATGNVMADMKSWLSAALINGDTCLQGFDDTNGVVKKMIAVHIQKLSSLVFGILTNIRSFHNNFSGGGGTGGGGSSTAGSASGGGSASVDVSSGGHGDDKVSGGSASVDVSSGGHGDDKVSGGSASVDVSSGGHGDDKSTTGSGSADGKGHGGSSKHDKKSDGSSGDGSSHGKSSTSNKSNGDSDSSGGKGSSKHKGSGKGKGSGGTCGGFKGNNGGASSGGKKISPEWMKSQDMKSIESSTSATANVVVAADGSGDYKKIQDAIDAAPDCSNTRFVIYIKKGVYKEYVEISKKKLNIMLIGDGIDATVISGNRNYIDGWTTYRSATFAVRGEGFIARDITFENTAGPGKHQAVAFRSESDLSVLYRCAFRGYQDTLYCHSQRQFFRDCIITGTVDFIFGDAAAVFQNCQILARKGLSGQKNTITAQGRKEDVESTGFSIQFCNISAEADVLTSLNSVKTYLGRPWKQYSRTVIMESYISNAISAEGWLEWEGDFALGTLFYAEYNNRGPGASVQGRVKWPGCHFIQKSVEVEFFTVSQFIIGHRWLPSTGVEFTAGLKSSA